MEVNMSMKKYSPVLYIGSYFLCYENFN